MTPNTFLQDLGDIKRFYKQTSQYQTILPSIAAGLALADPALQSLVAQDVTKSSSTFAHLLRKMVPVMLCTVWESFVEHLCTNDLPRYQNHFPVLKKWYSTPVQEIALMRHCISHKNGKIDSEYLKKSTVRTFNTLGQVIDFSEPEIDLQFEAFETAYQTIMA